MSNTATIAVEQTTSATFAEGAITVDYPSGIVANELMILVLFCSELDTISTPSGWTVVSNTTTVFQGDVDTDVYIYRKVVSAGDVTAGNISVDVDDTSGELAYVCFRISGYNTTTPVEQTSSGDDSSTGTSRAHTVSITPSTSGSLLIVCSGWDGQGTTGSYSATGSPSFTEVADFQRSTTDTVSVAYAQINNTTEITSLSFASSVSTSRSQQIGFLVRTSVDSTDTPTFVSSTQTAFTPSESAGVNLALALTESTQTAFPTTGFANSQPSFTNNQKNSVSFANQNKNIATFTNVTKNEPSWINLDKT